MESYIKELASHPTAIFERSTRQLIKIADGLINSPGISNYDQLNMRKPPLHENVSLVSGAYEALLAMGYVEACGPDAVHLPDGSPLDAVRKVRGLLAGVLFSKEQKVAASLAWQRTRCEAAFPAWRWALGGMFLKHREQQKPTEEDRGYSFVPSDECIDAKRMRVLYSCVTDRYELRSSDASKGTYIRGWQNGVFRLTDVFRKTEHDWQMVYLARRTNEQEGRIAWRIDLHHYGQRARSVAVSVTSQTFFNGSVQWSLCGSRHGHSYDGCSGVVCLPLYGNGERQRFEAFSGCDEIWLVACLSGGSGDVAWQYAQLFRASAGAPEESARGFDIVVELA